LKLLLDEHFSRRVAVEMRSRGHDVIAVSECDDLRGLPDSDLFAHVRSMGYVVVTQDYADFASLVREATLDEAEYPGVIFVPRRVWRSLQDLEQLVEALERLAGDPNPGGVLWIG
jgi:Domain of unknown function (DUF5615)